MSSTWLTNIEIPKANPPLSGTVKADVAIIGGGLCGTLSAYLLAKMGKKVVLLEQEDITNTTTAYTTAWLSKVIDTDLPDLVKMYGSTGAQKSWYSGQSAIDFIEKVIMEEKIECDFMHVSHFSYATDQGQLKDLQKEHLSASLLGLDTVLHKQENLNFKNEGSLEFKKEAKFHPIKFLIGLRKAAEKYGAVFYDHSKVLNIEDNIAAGSVIVKAENGKVEASHSITATYKPFDNPKELFAHKGIYVSYVYEVNIPAGTIAEGLYADGNKPYHYFRIDNMGDHDRMVLGGEDHRQEIKMDKNKSYGALENYLKELLPNVEYKIVRRWSGHIIETIDGLPYIGQYAKDNPNKLIATGFSGNGMTYSAIAAQIFTDIILKNPNPYIEFYSPLRKTKLKSLIIKGIDFTGIFFGGALKNFFRK